jgi:hypothetical protein
MRMSIEGAVKKYGLKLVLDKEYLRPNSMAIAGNTIYYNVFDEEECMLLAFYHEVGHTKLSLAVQESPYLSRYTLELMAWSKGLELAESDFVYFTDEAIQWGLSQCQTYFGWDKREVRDYEKNYAPMLWANQGH